MAQSSSDKGKWLLKLTDRTEFELSDKIGQALAKELDNPSGADFVVFEIDGEEYRVKRTLIGVLQPIRNRWF
jgi:hypothetical protein